MLGHKSREFRRQVAVSLDAPVPQENFYRQVDRCIDRSFVRDLAEDFYSSFGRPSIDPGGFLPAAADRWFVGYDLAAISKFVNGECVTLKV